MNQPPNLSNEAILFTCGLLAFCVIMAIIGQPGPYVLWSVIFGLILVALIRNKR